MFLVGPLDPQEPRFLTAKRNRADRPWVELLGPLAHAGGATESGTLFIGRRLEPFLAEARHRSRAGTVLAHLSAREEKWRDAGAGIGAAAQMLIEGHVEEGNAAMRAAAAELPPEVRTAVLGPAGR